MTPTADMIEALDELSKELDSVVPAEGSLNYSPAYLRKVDEVISRHLVALQECKDRLCDIAIELGKLIEEDDEWILEKAERAYMNAQEKSLLHMLGAAIHLSEVQEEVRRRLGDGK